MRKELLDAYWDVQRDGLSCKQAADRRGVNSGQLWKILHSSVISRPLGRPTAFDEFEEFIMASYVRNMQLMERPLMSQQILDGFRFLVDKRGDLYQALNGECLAARSDVFCFSRLLFNDDTVC